MPIWCDNKIILAHKNTDMLLKAFDGFYGKGLFKEFLPVPQDLLDAEPNNVRLKFYSCYDVEASDFDFRNHLTRQLRENLIKHGFQDWVYFCEAKWGTKWDVSGQLSEDQKHIKRNEAITSSKLCLSFKTARNPPLYFLTHLVFSGFDATMYYNNPVLEYCGKWQNGLDIRINYDSMTAEELKLSIPKDWDVSFGEVA